jgi:hypothetical protein
MRRYPRAAPPGQNSTVMPAQYSPRDFVEAACVPGKGERINLDSLTPYGFFFATTAIRQENPSSVFSMQPHLFLNDTLSTDYFIADFALYKGPLDSVPAVCRYDWFFWKRLAEYIRLTETDRSVKLSFTLYQDNARIGSYVFREQFLFLLADNWDKGYDSRYFGPVAESRVFGRPFLVLWSFRRTADGGTGFSIRRLGRILW